MSIWAPTKYKTTNWSAYNEALKRRGSLSIWFNPQMDWVPPPSGKRGRQKQFSDAAIQTCLTLKVLFGMPLRQTTGLVTADGAYDTRKCHDAIAARGAHAIIPPRKNAKP